MYVFYHPLNRLPLFIWQVSVTHLSATCIFHTIWLVAGAYYEACPSLIRCIMLSLHGHGLDNCRTSFKLKMLDPGVAIIDLCAGLYFNQRSNTGRNGIASVFLQITFRSVLVGSRLARLELHRRVHITDQQDHWSECNCTVQPRILHQRAWQRSRRLKSGVIKPASWVHNNYLLWWIVFFFFSSSQTFPCDNGINECSTMMKRR